ncbi:hypothetical protein [Pseudomonas parafulva]|uniref:hypothetical protein n=1 Tax=Pseudomonas parafulva TaxID=157782 RepID=UPI00128F28E5|nr:hypothetical protein [Pseudomonas parafulva]
MKCLSLFVLFFVILSGRAESSELDYKLVLTAGTGVVDGDVVRYLTVFNESCLVVQIVASGDVGKVVTDSRICGIAGKDFSEEFADFSFEQGFFTDQGLFFDVVAAPFRPMGEKRLRCKVVFDQRIASHLSCDGGHSTQ